MLAPCFEKKMIAFTSDVTLMPNYFPFKRKKEKTKMCQKKNLFLHWLRGSNLLLQLNLQNKQCTLNIFLSFLLLPSLFPSFFLLFLSNTWTGTTTPNSFYSLNHPPIMHCISFLHLINAPQLLFSPCNLEWW